jgi:hypothetical protein
VTLAAWCGHCGESFALAEVVTPSGETAVGACPRCGVLFAPAYTAVIVSATRRLIDAAAALDEALGQLRDMAPALHVEHRPPD